MKNNTNLKSFYSVHEKYGRTGLFDKGRDIIDIGANRDKCYNALPFCGNRTNVLVND